MPATFPSHAGAVLPLKLWRPHWFDGVALVVGAALPDLVYAGGCCGPPFTAGHTWWGVLFGVPVTMVLAAIVRRAVPGVVAHLPPLGTLALRDYAILGVVRHPWWITASSALLGSVRRRGRMWSTRPGLSRAKAVARRLDHPPSGSWTPVGVIAPTGVHDPPSTAKDTSRSPGGAGAALGVGAVAQLRLSNGSTSVLVSVLLLSVYVHDHGCLLCREGV